MKKQMKSVIALVAICAVVAILMAATNFLTKPMIEENEARALADALGTVLPGGENFELLDLSGKTLPKTVSEVYREANGGYAVKLVTRGFEPNMVILCGVSADGTVAGVTCLSSGETLGWEKTYGKRLVGSSSADIDSVDTVSGATKTTKGYRDAVKDALSAVEILKGGEQK